MTQTRKSDGIDKLISALYLAQSDTREKMLSELIKNVLFELNEPVRQEKIMLYIKNNFHLEPITTEINSVLNQLVQDGLILFNSPYYILSEVSKSNIYAAILKNQEESDRRFEMFLKIVKEISAIEYEVDDIKNVWEVFNEYLLDCFMFFGRRAIEIFLPYEEMSISEDEDIHKDACSKVSKPELVELFKKLVVEYPNRLSSLELRYLTTVANRAERFYSLGIEKSEYDKISSLKIKDLVVVLDTNVLYSVLNLRYHSENSVIDELIKIANSKAIDLRLVYIGKTYSELHKAKQYLETVISQENFRPNHIKALLASNKLDSFARQFYETKLTNSSTPHPSSKITYASDLLKSRGVNLYNHSFPKIDSKESDYLKGKITDYYDFQKKYNFHKTDPNIFHDVYLREAVIDLKERYSNENELKFICITLDNSLVYFDQFMFRKTLKTHTVVNPNFILPSVFLKRIRPFIPIITNDYRKAFLISLTSPTHDSESKDQSLLVQKSMSYFKSLGIEDEEIIMNCIKKDLFLEELSKIEDSGAAQEFLLSEVGEQIKNLQEEKVNFQREVLDKIQHKEKQIEDTHKSLEELQRDLSEKDQHLAKDEAEINKLKSAISLKDDAIGNMSDRVLALETYQLDLLRKYSELEKDQRRKENLLRWESDKSLFLSRQWTQKIPSFRNDALYLLRSIIIMILPIIIAVFISIYKESLEKYIKENNLSIDFSTIYMILGGAQLVELFFRTYIVDKERVKNGWQWGLAFFSRKLYKRLHDKHDLEMTEKYKQENPLLD